MRVISQDGTIDIPYECYTIWRYKDQYLDVYHIACDCGETDYRRLADYSTEAKAIKAMEMLREQYGKLEVMKVPASDTTEYMEKALTTDEIIKHYNTYCDMNVFHFPQDDEIAV